MKRISIYRMYAVFVALYFIVIMLMPANKVTLDTYDLSVASYRILLVATSAIPAYLTWFAAFYGYEQLRRYNMLIAKSKESAGFSNMTRGSFWVAMYLPVVSILSLALWGVANAHPGFRGTSLLLTNYVAILIALFAFFAFSTGGRQIAAIVKARPTLLRTRLASLAFIVMGVFYCYFVVEHSFGGARAYHLPMFWLLISVVVPYYFAWFMGLLAVLDIDAYATVVPGVLYRTALRRLSGGLLLVIAASILIQYVNSADTGRGRLVLGSVLLVHYVLYAFLAGGFALIGNSAKKLQQIEKI